MGAPEQVLYPPGLPSLSLDATSSRKSSRSPAQFLEYHHPLEEDSGAPPPWSVGDRPPPHCLRARPYLPVAGAHGGGPSRTSPARTPLPPSGAHPSHTALGGCGPRRGKAGGRPFAFESGPGALSGPFKGRRGRGPFPGAPRPPRRPSARFPTRPPPAVLTAAPLPRLGTARACRAGGAGEPRERGATRAPGDGEGARPPGGPLGGVA